MKRKEIDNCEVMSTTSCPSFKFIIFFILLYFILLTKHSVIKNRVLRP